LLLFLHFYYSCYHVFLWIYSWSCIFMSYICWDFKLGLCASIRTSNKVCLIPVMIGIFCQENFFQCGFVLVTRKTFVTTTKIQRFRRRAPVPKGWFAITRTKPNQPYHSHHRTKQQTNTKITISTLQITKSTAMSALKSCQHHTNDYTKIII